MATGTPIFDRLLDRSRIDWGEAPKYTEEYRKIRWPISPAQTVHYRLVQPTTPQPGLVGTLHRMDEDPRTPEGMEQVPEGERGITLTRTYRPRPTWKRNLDFQRHKKLEGRWRRRDTRIHLMVDIRQCMRENIPFKTPTFEYKPEDQWLYIKGRRAIKYDIRKGYISAFTFSGVYDKVTSLGLRIMGIKVQLQGRKLKWFCPRYGRSFMRGRLGRPEPLTEDVDIDINRVYTHDMMYSSSESAGFIVIDHALNREYLNSLTESTNEH